MGLVGHDLFSSFSRMIMTVIVVKIMAMNIIIMMSIRRFIVMTISLYEYCHRDDDIDRIEYQRRFFSDYCHRDDDRVE